jgi:predicted RNA-binding Zn ribbon-like protein
MRYDGGAPALNEPLAIEFANTWFYADGSLHEGIGTREHLAGWLAERGPGTGTVPVTESDVARFVTVRDSIRAAAHALSSGVEPDDDAVARINAAAAAAPSWPHLSLEPLSVVDHTEADRATAALAAIARSAIELFGGPDRPKLRACQAPHCVLHFVKNHPRREWCSAGCGNRARVSRYYHRHKTDSAAS